ncbi:MAG: lipid-A-disaccharide synthase [Gemmatimonadota bacterium]
MLAGEASGDHHGAQVARALRERWPDATLIGLGGDRMAAEGVELLAGLDDLAVMGFAEVVARLPWFLGLERRVKELLVERKIDLVLPIDYPGLNLRIARAAHERKIPVLYYISPQVWAWRAGRAARLARDADHVAVILPFEVDVLEKAGARVSFVGHPLLDRPDDTPEREEFCRTWGLDPAGPILPIFPGSRRQELERHLERFVAAAERVRAARPDVQIVLARASSVTAGALEGLGYPVIDDTRALLRHGRAALVKSGTTTLEAALEGVPFVVAYRTHPLTFWLARRLVRVDHVALANLVAGERVVPELLQDDATPEALASALLPLVDDSPAREAMLRGLGRVRSTLGTPGAAERVAELAGALVDDPPGRLPA